LYELARYMATSVPFDEGDMYKQSQQYYAAEARKGVYNVHRLLGPEQPLQKMSALPESWYSEFSFREHVWTACPIWAPSGLLLSAASNAPVHAPSPAMCVNALNDCNTVSTFYMPDGTGPTSLPQTTLTVPPWLSEGAAHFANLDSGFDNVSQSVTIFRGISISASIDVKRHLTLEISPTARSSLAPFVHPPLPYEPRALAAYFLISHHLAHTHSADANDLGKIFGKIMSIVSKILPAAAGALSMAEPGIAPLVMPLGEAAAWGAGKLAQRFGPRK
jgi:hypothetical protein